MFDDKINQANGRLKTARVRARIQRFGDKLYLQATLPPKPGSDATRSYQQRIALGISASPAGISLAEKEARKISALLDCKEFEWEPYLLAKNAPPETVGEWVERFEREFKHTVETITWETDYQEPFKRLHSDVPLTLDLLLNAIEETEPNTRTRKRVCQAFGKLAKVAGIEADFNGLKGSYSAKSVDPRSLPSDEEITQNLELIKNDQWRYVYGLIAAFGLRPHEAFFLDTGDLVRGGETISVVKGLSNTRKHRQRQIWALYPEWIEAFHLRQGTLPAVTGKRHSDYGDRVSQYFHRDAKLPFGAYDLRHCWAVRRIRFGFPDSLSAQQMGHSLTVHTTTYQAWTTARTHQEMQDRVMMRSDRPVAPNIKNQESELIQFS